MYAQSHAIDRMRLTVTVIEKHFKLNKTAEHRHLPGNLRVVSITYSKVPIAIASGKRTCIFSATIFSHYKNYKKFHKMTISRKPVLFLKKERKRKESQNKREQWLKFCSHGRESEHSISQSRPADSLRYSSSKSPGPRVAARPPARCHICPDVHTIVRRRWRRRLVIDLR